MIKQFINYIIFVFDKTFGLVPMYQHKMRDQNLVICGNNFKVNALLLTKIKFERHKGLKWFE
jgi:hypothetical protein